MDTSYRLSFKINGRDAAPELSHEVIEIVVDDSLHLPDMFTIRVYDETLHWVDSDQASLGAEVEILARVEDSQSGERPGQTYSLLQGEITGLEMDLGQDGRPILTVRGYERSHRLHRGVKSRSFLHVTDSEIAQKIAQEARLQARVDPTAVVYDYVFQNNQTDLEFLLTRAQRIGYQVYVEDRTLHFHLAGQDQGEGPRLTWRENLRSFHPLLSTFRQVDEVIVRGWDPQSKREIVGRAASGRLEPQVGLEQTGGETTHKAFNLAARAVIVNQPVSNVDDANEMAQAVFDEISGDFIQAEGACFGDPRVQAGKVVEVCSVGARFSGKYFVSSAIHTYTPHGYETTFHVSGSHPATLGYLLKTPGKTDGYRLGMVIGLVTNNKDPRGLGRVKVRFPWLSDKEESAWARLVAPMGGKDKGFYCLPEVNDEVLVGFEQGDIHYPYILGVLWNGKDLPPHIADPAVGRDGRVNQRILRSRSGHEVILDDTPGNEKIILRDQSGQTQVVLDSASNSLLLTAAGQIRIESGGEVSIRGKSVVVDGSARVDVKGGAINLN